MSLHHSRVHICDLFDFVQCARTENISAVAKEFNDKQENVSRHIQRLEEALDIKLFERSKNAIRLNDEGRLLFKAIRVLIPKLEEALSLENASGHSRKFRVGFAPSFSKSLPKIVRLFESKMPNIKVVRNDLDSAECVKGLLKGKLDVAFMVRPSRNNMRRLDYEEISKIERCCAVSINHNLAGRPFVMPEDIVDERIIAFTEESHPEYAPRMRAHFKHIGRRPRIICEYADIVSLLDAVEAEEGIAIVPEEAPIRQGIRVKLVPFRTQSEALEVGVLFAIPKSKLARQFIECAKNALQK